MPRVAETPSAALGAEPVVTSRSSPTPTHSATAISTSILDLPDIEPDGSEGQFLLPLGRSRSPSPPPRYFLGVTSQTISDPLELADLRAQSLAGPSTSAAPVGSEPSVDWHDRFGFGMPPSALMAADPAVLLVTPVGDSPASQSFVEATAPAPGDSNSSPRVGRSTCDYFTAVGC